MSILRADSIRDRAGTGAPDFPNGLTGNVTGTATTATVATNAQGITGTPNITVGTVTGTDATFSGNLTVQGTTTTIDTAVTAVDSLAVDGQITGLGNLGIGTVTPLARTHIVGSSSGGGKLFIDTLGTFSGTDTSTLGFSVFRGGSNARSNSQAEIVCVGDGNYSGSLVFKTQNPGTYPNSLVERLHINSGGTAIFKAGLAEKYNKGTTLAAASNNVALTSGNVHRFTSNESGAQTVNFTGVHSTLADGESVSFTVLVTPANSGYINAATVDGVAPGGGLKWSGGSAPSSGGASGRDVYTFTIFKDGTATNSYEIFGAVQNYA